MYILRYESLYKALSPCIECRTRIKDTSSKCINKLIMLIVDTY